MKNEKKNIFISHIHKDDSKLKDLKKLLEKHGIDRSKRLLNQCG